MIKRPLYSTPPPRKAAPRTQAVHDVVLPVVMDGMEQVVLSRDRD